MEVTLLKRVKTVGGTATIQTAGKVLVVPTGNHSLLPNFNEYTLTSGRTLPDLGTYIFTNDYNSNTGLKNINKNWIAILDPTKTIIDFFMFNYKPNALKIVVSNTYNGYYLLNDGTNFILNNGDHFCLGTPAITSLTLY